MRAIVRKNEITVKEIEEMIPQMTEMVRVLGEADPTDKNDLYTQMGLTLVYDPSESGRRRSEAQHVPECVSEGDTLDKYMPFVATTRLVLAGRGV